METKKLEFSDLANLRLFLHDLRGRQSISLLEYYDATSGGFAHRYDERKPGELSKSSTATCVLSLTATKEWRNKKMPWGATASKLANGLLEAKWASAGLAENNLFTMSFILEAVAELQEDDPGIVLSPAAQEKLAMGEARLKEAVREGREALNVEGYPPSAYVAQLVVRALKKRKLPVENVKDISEWAESEINRQIALLTRGDKTADVFQLAYSTILLTAVVEPTKVTPDQEFIVEAALDLLFERQREDGTWPLSRPLFHYPKVGSAHCYDYEMLVQLLSERPLGEKLLRFIPQLSRSALALQSYFPLGSASPQIGRGWSSGHHPQLKGPESWSTASVYHFAHVFERLLAEQIRIETFAYLGTAYAPPRKPDTIAPLLPPARFLDAEVELDGGRRSLAQVVGDQILRPLAADVASGRVDSGGVLDETTPVSVILFGPPGTSKTELAKLIAEIVGWPLLTIDASQFLKNGMDGVYREADVILGRLAIAERVVVLLDEFDEMVRARETAPDVLSRFLTTAMLPKLHKIHDNRRLIFIVATNHIDWFDAAIRRPGRFDVILQVMPPTALEKRQKWGALHKLVDSGIELATLDEKLAPMTFLEAKTLASKLESAPDDGAKLKLLADAYEKCTMLSEVPTSDKRSNSTPGMRERIFRIKPKKTTWQDVCERQKSLSRVP
jgi:hypothetical protein